MAPWTGIVFVLPAAVWRVFHIGQVRQISVESRTMICCSFQQHQKESAADSQYGRGINNVGTDQWQV